MLYPPPLPWLEITIIASGVLTIATIILHAKTVIVIGTITVTTRTGVTILGTIIDTIGVTTITAFATTIAATMTAAGTATETVIPTILDTTVITIITRGMGTGDMICARCWAQPWLSTRFLTTVELTGE